MFASKKAEAKKKWREEQRETGEEGGMKPLFSFHKISGEYGLTCCIFSDLIIFATSSVCSSLCSMLSRLMEIIKGIMSKIAVYL